MDLLHQTYPVTLPKQNDLQKAIHAHHWQERESIILSLEESATKSIKRTAYKLSACAESARLYLDVQKQHVRTIITRCRQRICPWCTHARTARAKVQILAIMATMHNPRSIVLTARSNDRPLDQQISALRQAFRKFRTYKQWKTIVTGGVYTLEVTYNPRAGTWHPHVHIIADGQFFPQPLLSKLWKRATGDSDIVWISKADNAPKAAMELAGYIGKPPKIKEMPAAALREYVAATRSVRMLQTFGTARDQKAEDRDELPAPPKDQDCITINRIRFLARHGQPEALLLATAIPHRWPLFAGFFNPDLRDKSPPQQKPTNEERAATETTIVMAFTSLLQLRDTGGLDLYDLQDTW